MDQQTKTLEEFTPRVWVSTHGLYSAGYLIGYWCDAAEAPETLEEFMTALNAPVSTERTRNLIGSELWCFDVENMPGGECSTAEARAFAAAFEEIPEEYGPALLAMAEDQHVTTAEEFTALAERFEEYFLGYFDTLEDYAAEYLDSTGMLDTLPDYARNYFDVEAFARDVAYDVTLLTDRSGGTFVVQY